MALPYHVRDPKKVLVIGAGGGTDVLLALRQNASRIIALESNPQVAGLITGPFATSPGICIRSRRRNFLSEMLASFFMRQRIDLT